MKAFLKTNWSIIALIIVVVLFGVFFMTRQSGNKVASATDPSGLVSQPSAPATGNSTGVSAPVPVGTTTFCLRLDGRENGHLPALMGSAAQNAYANGLNGSNWSLPANSSGQEPYGIMSDGTVFAKESFLKQYGMVSFVEIKCDKTGWMAEQMTPAKIGGEAAWVFKIN